MATLKRLHIIPAGGEEPVHLVSLDCKCHPNPNDDAVVIHNAFDLRELRERHGRRRPGDVWVIVEEKITTSVGLNQSSS